MIRNCWECYALHTSTPRIKYASITPACHLVHDGRWPSIGSRLGQDWPGFASMLGQRLTYISCNGIAKYGSSTGYSANRDIKGFMTIIPGRYISATCYYHHTYHAVPFSVLASLCTCFIIVRFDYIY